MHYFLPSPHIDLGVLQLSTRALIPLELCEVPPGQIIRKQMPQEHINSILKFSSMHPNERYRSIRNALTVCYVQVDQPTY